MTRRIQGPVDIRRAFQEIVLSKPAWDRSKTVGASEAFRCIRRTFFTKFEPDSAQELDHVDVEWGYSERGTEVERNFAVPKLKALFGEENCFLMGDEQQTFIDGFLSATPDGIIVDLPPDALRNYEIDKCSSEIAPEIKSFDPRMNLSGGPKPFWVGQNIVQMGLYRRKTNYRPDNGIIVAINCSNYKDIRIYATRYDETIYERAKQRAARVFEAGATPASFEPEGQTTGECDSCPFYGRCHEVEIERYPDKIVPLEELAQETVDALRAKARTVAALRKQCKEAEAARSKAEAELKELMFSIGSNHEGGEDWSVTLVKNKGRASLDKAALLEAGIEPQNFMREGNPFLSMRVKG